MSYYVTTPIYYPNASPHLGHAYTTIAADVVSRFQRLMGENSFFLTGTDEHGSKIAEAAEAAGQDPQTFVNGISQVFRDLLPVLDAGEHRFIRTTDSEHEAFVRMVATRMHDKGDIYEDTYIGPYCTACERYYAENELLDGDLCPIHKREVQRMEETNWFFRLSAYRERLQQHFADNPEWIRPKSRYNEAISLIDQLEDLSISRSSISWGVDVPWDESQVFYVWIDALFNYRSALEYLVDDEDAVAKYWPPQLQVIGKDILKFHAIYWPAFLMAADIELPKQLFAHGFLTATEGGDKMGKSMGNALDPFPLIEQLGADPVRFYVLRDVSFGQDGAVSREAFERRYDGELANDLGNLVSRSAAMLVKYRGSDGVAKVPATDASSEVAAAATAMVARWREQMQSIELSNALETVWVYVRELNRLVEERAPWKLAKAEDGAEALDTTLGELAEGLLAIAHALTPVMPSTSAKIAGIFGVDADTLAGWTWGIGEGRDVTKPAPLFPRLESTIV